MGIRTVGLVINSVIAGVTAVIGWFMGGLIPIASGTEVTE
jgi:hypothetical protein